MVKEFLKWAQQFLNILKHKIIQNSILYNISINKCYSWQITSSLTSQIKKRTSKRQRHEAKKQSSIFKCHCHFKTAVQMIGLLTYC